MSDTNLSADDQKRIAAEAALAYIKDGMKVGLGTGSTAAYFVTALGRKAQDEGLTLACVPTSEATDKLAREVGLTVTTLDDQPHLDVTVDGADEIGPRLTLIKGGGGALLREKIVAFASSQMIVIADESKVVPHLGNFPLPIEVVPFGAQATGTRILESGKLFGCDGAISLRTDEYGEPFVTDGNNLIYDWALGEIPDPDGLGEYLSRLPGVVEHGLFLGIAHAALIGKADGSVDTLNH
ncbi:ribose-5-phosphate isomerase RpiA [Pyruvatibacter mobilis]|uniref:ribose-5-phosphate isomerase RpiA n=1 Tax=Pyruvatibacter mobilis TaxID=1712261 RepID=UPI003BB17B5C